MRAPVKAGRQRCGPLVKSILSALLISHAKVAKPRVLVRLLESLCVCVYLLVRVGVCVCRHTGMNQYGIATVSQLLHKEHSLSGTAPGITLAGQTIDPATGKVSGIYTQTHTHTHKHFWFLIL